jgi:hypothetical protein
LSTLSPFPPDIAGISSSGLLLVVLVALRAEKVSGAAAAEEVNSLIVL